MTNDKCLPAIALACPLVPHSGRRAQARRARLMTKMMKGIIEQIVKQEIRGILAENEDMIREIVESSLVQELRAAIRDSISSALEDLIKETPESIDTQEVVEEAAEGGRAGGHLGSGKISPESNSSGRYLYCIAEASERISLGKSGLENNEVYTIPYDDLCAVVHNCPAEPYESEDQKIVQGWIVTHQKVVDAAWERFGAVLPMGFDTIIRGNQVADPEENMRRWLDKDYENLKAKIEKVRGRAEYGVQVFWDPKVVAQKITHESLEIKKLDEEVKSKPRGLAYMYRQKFQDLLKKEMEKQADRYFKEFYERIKQYVDDLRVDKTKKTEDENKQMLMNISCLLAKDERKRLGDELEKIDALEGLSVRYTGPWPPYSFV